MNQPIDQAIVLCGGKGTRLGGRVRHVPKPMLPVGGRPLLDHIIDSLRAAGIRRFILIAGHLAEVITRHYDSQDRPGCSIDICVEPEPHGTAGGLRSLADRLDEGFIVAYGDVFIDFDIAQLIAAHRAEHPIATLLVRASDHPWDCDLVVADQSGRVLDFVRETATNERCRNVANAAVYVLSRRILEHIPTDRASDFVRDVFPAALRGNELIRAHPLEESAFVKDMGTPERLEAVEEYLRERDLARAARTQRKPVDTVFLDRDGVLNVDFQVIDRPERLELLPGAAEAVCLLNRHGIRCVVVTNQPLIARGLCTEETLARINDQLRAELSSAGGSLAGFFHCPHHPDTHHGEGVRELRRACRCRKPSPGLIFRAQRELQLNLGSAVMVGDRSSDVRAGRAAGLRTVLVGPTDRRDIERCAGAPDAEFDSLLTFAHALVERRVFHE